MLQTAGVHTSRHAGRNYLTSCRYLTRRTKLSGQAVTRRTSWEISVRSTFVTTSRTCVCVLSVLLGSVGLLPTFATPLAAQQEDSAPTLTAGRILTLVKGDRAAEVREPFRAIVVDDVDTCSLCPASSSWCT